MKIEVTQGALLGALVESIRDERDHGAAMMRQMLRFVNEASKQGWFETHWRTGARLELVQLVCGDVPKQWKSSAQALEVIAEAARWGLKADQTDGERRATLLAITRLADVERGGQPVAAVAKTTRRSKPKTARRKIGQQATATPRAKVAARKPASARTTAARKANGATPIRKASATAKPKAAGAAKKTARKSAAKKGRKKAAARKSVKRRSARRRTAGRRASPVRPTVHWSSPAPSSACSNGSPLH